MKEIQIFFFNYNIIYVLPVYGAYGSNQCLAVCVYVCMCGMQKHFFFFFFFFFLTMTHHGSIVLAFPANHMSRLLMFMPPYINQIGLKMICWCKISENK